MSDYPSHSNRYRAEMYILDCEYKIPYQLMEEGITLEKVDKTQEALNKYIYALSKVKNDTVASNLLNGRIDQVALLWMIESEKLLKQKKYIPAYNLVKHVSEFSLLGKREIRRFKSWVILGEGIKYQDAGFIGKAMGKYSEALKMNTDLIHEVKALQYRAGIQMAKLANQADEFEEIQLAIYSLEFARELTGGIGGKNEALLRDLKDRLKAYDSYNSRSKINKIMDFGRYELSLARSKKLEVGQTLPEVEILLGKPHDKVIGDYGKNVDNQLWIYFLEEKTLCLSFHKFKLFKIEEI